MNGEQTTKSLDWKLPEIADKAENQKLKDLFHEEEKELNKNRLLYPPEDIGPASQLTYTRERRS